VAWAVQKLVEASHRDLNVVFNVQGDHPGIDPEHFDPALRCCHSVGRRVLNGSSVGTLHADSLDGGIYG
jgi:CMP-2-keto-3-deoxyoctulosonic acid synthetase